MPLSTYAVGFNPGTGGNREDLLDAIVNISPAETPLVSTMPRTPVEHVRHDWLTDSLAATSTAGAIEGVPFASGALSVRTRSFNIVQTFRKGLRVSNDQRAANPAGVDDEYKYQVMKTVREKARDLERRIWSASGTSASGTTGVARTMRTLQDFILVNRFHVRSTSLGHAGGGATACATNLTEGGFNSLLARIFAQGGFPDVIHTNIAGKRQISAFTGGSNTRRNIAMNDKMLTIPVDIYESEIGPLEIVLNRWVRQAANTPSANGSRVGQIFALERSMVRLGEYRPMAHVPLPPDGADATRGEVIGSYTIEVGNGLALGRLFGVNSRFPAS